MFNCLVVVGRYIKQSLGISVLADLHIYNQKCLFENDIMYCTAEYNFVNYLIDYQRSYVLKFSLRWCQYVSDSRAVPLRQFSVQYRVWWLLLLEASTWCSWTRLRGHVSASGATASSTSTTSVRPCCRSSPSPRSRAGPCTHHARSLPLHSVLSLLHAHYWYLACVELPSNSVRENVSSNSKT